MTTQLDDKRMMTANESGEEVVGAVISKIQKSKIFPHDHNLLDRVAWVESRFGTHPATYRPGYHGGIWQVDEAGFHDTQAVASHPALRQKHARIQTEFGIQWSTVRYEELRKPFYSALACRLKFSNVPGKHGAIHDDVGWQAKYWKDFYNSHHPNAKGSPEKFLEDVRLLDDLRRTK